MYKLDMKEIALLSLMDVMFDVIQLFIYYKIGAFLFHFHLCFD